MSFWYTYDINKDDHRSLDLSSGIVFINKLNSFRSTIVYFSNHSVAFLSSLMGSPTNS